MKKIAEEIKSAEQLYSVISDTLKAEGLEEKQYDGQKAYEFKKALSSVETKANEVVHTINTGFGAELVPGAVQTTDFLDMVPKYNGFISALTGYHGRNLNKIQEVPVIGRVAKHLLDTEWTTGTPVSQIVQGKGKLPTAKVTLTQKKYMFSIDISDEEFRFVNVLDIVTKIKEKLAASVVETQNSLILNGDVATALNTNINLIDGTPGGTEHYLGADGLRKTALTGTGTKVNVNGAISYASLLNTLAVLGDRAGSPENLIWLFNRSTYVQALGIAELASQLVNGRSSTVFTGSVTNLLGSDVFLNSDFGKTTATGEISGTGANNTKGGFMLLDRNAVQYGFNGDYNIELYRVPGKGWQVLGYYYMGCAVANQLAGETTASVALAYNVTV